MHFTIIIIIIAIIPMDTHDRSRFEVLYVHGQVWVHIVH